MNIFDLPGPTFLGVWLVGCAGVLAVALVMRWVVARSNARGSAAELADKLHPTEIAYLAGGITRAIEAAIAGLHHRGAVEVDADAVIRVTGKAGDLLLRPDGVFRGVLVGAELSRVEAYVMERLPATVADLCTRTDALDVVLRRKLEEQGLLVENQARGTLLVRAPALLWLVVGGIKLAIGISRDKPVFLLLLLLGAGAFLVLRLRAPRLTSVGAELVRDLRYRYAALESTARTAPQQLDAADMTLAYGMYGYLVAPAVLMTAMPSYTAATAAAVTSVSSCSSSSCGSSCGGGCGGGCGGCS